MFANPSTDGRQVAKVPVPFVITIFGATGAGLTLAQTEYLLLDFFFSNNPDAPGNYTMGELS